MKILISGANGFIGSHLSKTLGDTVPIPQTILYDPIALPKFLKEQKPDYIYHLAAYGNHSTQQEASKIVFSNIFSSMNLLESSKDINYKRFINFSTSSVLLPIQTFYSISKVSVEGLAQLYAQEYNKPILTVRPYSIYGNGEADFRFIPKVINALLYKEEIELDPDATHDWVYVDDFIKALLAHNENGSVNLGTGYSYTNLEIVRKLERISGRKLRYKEKKMRNFDNGIWVCPEHTVVSDIDEGLFKTFTYYAKKYTSN